MVHMAGSTERLRVRFLELCTAPRDLDQVMGFETTGQAAPTTTPAVTVEDSPTEPRRPTAASAVAPLQAEAPTNENTTSRDGREPCRAASPTEITAAEHKSIRDVTFDLWIDGLPPTSRRTVQAPIADGNRTPGRSLIRCSSIAA